MYACRMVAEVSLLVVAFVHHAPVFASEITDSFIALSFG
jgi:hypothetical protein